MSHSATPTTGNYPIAAFFIATLLCVTSALLSNSVNANDSSSCTVTTGAGSTLGNAIAAFEQSCPGRIRKDCDPLDQGWQCSTESLPLESAQAPTSQPPVTGNANTVLTIQAENASQTSGSGWSTENSLSGFTGSGYIVWRGQDDFRVDDNAPPAGIKSYDFVVTQPGTYEFTARVQARVGNGNAAGDKDNDAWVRFISGSATPGIPGNSNKWTKFFVSGTDETWKNYTSGEQYDPTFFTEIKRDLPAGTHRVLIGGRSARFAIDSVALTLVTANGNPVPPADELPTVPAAPAVPDIPAPEPIPQTPGTPVVAVCTAGGNTLGTAILQYTDSCPGIPRVDCDQIGEGNWQCSSQVIGTAAPVMIAGNPPTTPENPVQSDSPATPENPDTPSTTACNAEGTSLNAAIAQFGSSCPDLARQDCDRLENGSWQCSSETIGSSAPGLGTSSNAPTIPVAGSPGVTPTPAPGNRFNGNDLIALHYDNCGDRDDGHAAVAGKAVVNSLGINNLIIVNGTCGHAIRSSYQIPSEDLMRVIWGNTWLDSYNDEEATIAATATRWATTLSNGDDVWVAEGGPSDFTAKVLRRISTVYPSVNRKRIHVVQHSAGTAFNESRTSAANIALVKQVATYIAIPNGNVANNGSAGLNQLSNYFVNIARQSRYASEWNAAFVYLNPNSRLDFSDTVELLYIIEDSATQNPDDFANRYLR